MDQLYYVTGSSEFSTLPQICKREYAVDFKGMQLAGLGALPRHISPLTSLVVSQPIRGHEFLSFSVNEDPMIVVSQA